MHDHDISSLVNIYKNKKQFKWFYFIDLTQMYKKLLPEEATTKEKT